MTIPTGRSQLEHLPHLRPTLVWLCFLAYSLGQHFLQTLLAFHRDQNHKLERITTRPSHECEQRGFFLPVSVSLQ